jgi:hypothetical protein
MAFNPATKRTLLATVPGTLPGVSFNVVLKADEGKTFVEFFDTRYPHTPFGQFVSSYYPSSIQGCYNGLDLMGYEPSWKVSAEGMATVHTLLKAQSLID